MNRSSLARGWNERKAKNSKQRKRIMFVKENRFRSTKFLRVISPKKAKHRFIEMEMAGVGIREE